ncbi:MAG: FAD-dependent oxidoreductase [Pseudomonadota bacterium]
MDENDRSHEHDDEILRDRFKALKREVPVYIFTRKGEKGPFNRLTVAVMTELKKLTQKIVPEFHAIGDKISKKYDVERSPTILIDPETHRIRYTGAPAGEEMRSFVDAIIMASQGESFLSDESKESLDKLTEARYIRVFVSPTCPYCPQQAALAVASAVERPDLVTAEIIEIVENRDLAEKYGVTSVPQTNINDEISSMGAEPEDVFIERLVTLKEPSATGPRIAPEGEDVRVDVVVVGGGPGGLTAGIYGERGGLRYVILEKDIVGGQVAATPVVENYPGLIRIAGKALADIMSQHALQYTHIHQGEEVLDIKPDETIEVYTNKGKYLCRAVILTTGAKYRKIGAPGEERLFGRGVSYCATCDGYFFKGKKAVMVGGGSSAVTEALYLDSLGVGVRLVHRRETLRAEARLQESLFERKIPVIWNSVVTEILGEKVVEGVRIENLKTGEIQEIQTDAVFVSVGYEPVNDLAKRIGLELDEDGYIRVDRFQRTSRARIYAAGDITGGIKQIVTAVGQAAVAAMTAFEDLSKPYWKKD